MRFSGQRCLLVAGSAADHYPAYNVNRSNTATHVAMYIITESKEPAFDLFLVQEPWWEKINQEFRMVSFPGCKTILPNHPIQTEESPTIPTYYSIATIQNSTLPNNI